MSEKQVSANRQEHIWLLTELEGILSGIAADGIINLEELQYLRYWLLLTQDYRELFPYSFLEVLVTEILEDGVVTPAESEEMRAFISAWSRSSHKEHGVREAFVTESRALQFVKSVPIDRHLTPLEIAQFRVLTDFFARREHGQLKKALGLLGRVLDDRIITREERSALVAEIRRKT